MGDTFGSGFHGAATVLRLLNGGEAGARSVVDAFPWDLWQKGRRTEDSRIHHDRLDARLVEQVTNELELGSFGVERADENDGHKDSLR